MHITATVLSFRRHLRCDLVTIEDGFVVPPEARTGQRVEQWVNGAVHVLKKGDDDESVVKTGL